jgi:hypothetical protein
LKGRQPITKKTELFTLTNPAFVAGQATLLGALRSAWKGADAGLRAYIELQVVQANQHLYEVEDQGVPIAYALDAVVQSISEEMPDTVPCDVGNAFIALLCAAIGM